MTTSLLLTLFITMLLPFLAKAPLAFAMQKSGGYDNHNPRAQQATLQGFGQRANAAHYNSFEALLIYACAVFSAVGLSAVDQTVVILGWVFIASRIAYLLCYWLDYATTRSVMWLVGIVAAFVIAGRAVLL
ncbi:MAG: MAPEG family protein [Gammaproteobacteria bacterium]|nr:MAPEG family protein [Gammaproteobacteria bacterium]MBU1554321.1 MAPEG family protein [Gammaproteobacteria bacterium]MBU2072505.1 MAPEG family protein [Gammaproteobacteria bacterium]MBU2181945.1 MAPEG family protein [Gammaproteobacteria bacterium]MBU2204251.1 MAPEG family protein [Gammaproteobacteria bacterium]